MIIGKKRVAALLSVYLGSVLMHTSKLWASAHCVKYQSKDGVRFAVSLFTFLGTSQETPSTSKRCTIMNFHKIALVQNKLL